jgi:hypothetical protein
MARVVVRNRDKVNEDDPYLDAKCTKRGMVVEILPDGVSLGAVGDAYDGWTVIEVPGASKEDVSALLAKEPGDPMLNRMLQRRAFKLDLDALGVPDTRRKVGAETMMTLAAAETPPLQLTLSEVLAVKAPIEPLADPNIL